MSQLFATPWTAAHQASLSITNSWSLLKLMCIELVMSSNHLILCCPLHHLPSIFPGIRVFSSTPISSEKEGYFPYRILFYSLSSSLCLHVVLVSHVQLFARVLCPWDSPGKNTGVGYHSLLRGIFPTQDWTHVSYVSCLGRRVPYSWATWGALPLRLERNWYLKLPRDKVCQSLISSFH